MRGIAGGNLTTAQPPGMFHQPVQSGGARLRLRVVRATLTAPPSSLAFTWSITCHTSRAPNAGPIGGPLNSSVSACTSA